MAITFRLVGTEQVLARFTAMPSKIRQALADEMRRQWFALQSHVVTSKLSGDPLRRRTGNLASSINVGGRNTATEFVDGGDTITGRVGTKVWYGFVHEYGGSYDIAPHSRRLTQVFGRPVGERTVSVSGYRATFPERSFLRTGLADMSTQIRTSLAEATRQSLGA